MSRSLSLYLLCLLAGCEGGTDRRVITPLADAEHRETKPEVIVADSGPPDVALDSGFEDVSLLPVTAFVLPPIDDVCALDADCAVLAIETSGPYVCCMSCKPIAVSKKWAAKAAICSLLAKKSCYPLACPMAVLKPKCVAGHCVGVP